MLYSRKGKFVFFHNPKAAGASVHKTLESWHDVDQSMHGLSADGSRWLSHPSIDEFMRFYPDLWDEAQDYRLYALWRDPQARFLSALSQYSRNYGEIETRFAAPDAQRAFALDMLEQLSRHTRAEEILDRVDYTFFRPQWVYLQGAHGDVGVRAFPMQQVERFLDDVETHVGAPLPRARVNGREYYRLPPALAKVLSRPELVARLRRMPGAGRAKRALQRSFAGSPPPRPFHLSEGEMADLGAFVRRFYQKDYDHFDRLTVQETKPAAPSAAHLVQA